MNNLRTDDLQINNLKIMQDPSLFCFGTDSVLLANFAKPNKNALILDIGTGNGIIPLLLTAKVYAKKIIGIEVQKRSYSLAKKNVALNSLDELVEIIEGDINDNTIFKGNTFDYITCNPPYKPLGGGIINPDDALKIARHEVLCTLSDIVRQSSRILKPSGKLSMVHKPERMAELIYTFKEYGIEPKRIQTVSSKEGLPPCLILLEGSKGGNPGLKFEKPILIYDNNGNYTAHIKTLYSKSKEN